MKIRTKLALPAALLSMVPESVQVLLKQTIPIRGTEGGSTPGSANIVVSISGIEVLLELSADETRGLHAGLDRIVVQKAVRT